MEARGKDQVEVIILGSVWFLPIKTTKPTFCKIQKKKNPELKPVQTDRF